MPLLENEINKRPTLKQTELLDALDPLQKDAVEIGVGQRSVGYFLEQGTGKTWVCGALIEQVIDEAIDFEAYLVVPLSNIETTWEKFLRERLPQLNWTRDWEEYKKLPYPRLFLMHWEAFTKKRQVSKLVRRKWAFGAFDESQRLKDRGSLSSRRAKQMRHCTYRKALLSGTPDDGNEMHYWAQFRYLAPFIFGTDWVAFDDEYLKPTGFMGYKRKFKKPKLKKFIRLIKPWCVYVSLEDSTGRPKPDIRRIRITMKGDQRRLYDELETTMLIKELDILTQFQMTKVMKLHQICGGHLIDEEYVYDIGRAKQRAAIRIIDKESLPIIVFCRFTEEIESLANTLRRRDYIVDTIQGSNRKTRNSVQRRFQEGRTDILVCQIRTGGVGIDLFRSHVAVIYSTTYSRIDFDQAMARINRRGQTYEDPVRVYFLMCKDSVDEVINIAIIEKRSVSKTVRTYLKRRRRQMAKKPSPKAKAAAAKRAKKGSKKTAKAPAEKMKFGVDDLATALGIKPASARVRLRNANVAKAGKSYGWNSQKDLDSVAKQLKTEKKAA